MMTVKVRAAQIGDRLQLAKLRKLLWPEGDFEEHLREFDEIVSRGRSGNLPVAILVAEGDSGSLAGFIEVGLRSHADGCNPARPVGFVEGWFVDQSFRKQGVGRDLMHAAEAWARGQGCREMASDALIDNEDSHGAHTALGFEIVDRCIHFKKNL